MKEPKLGEHFKFTVLKEWQAANKRANEKGLRACIVHFGANVIRGIWIKHDETTPQRPKTFHA